jgi:hypothetical protein
VVPSVRQSSFVDSVVEGREEKTRENRVNYTLSQPSTLNTRPSTCSEQRIKWTPINIQVSPPNPIPTTFPHLTTYPHFDPYYIITLHILYPRTSNPPLSILASFVLDYLPFYVLPSSSCFIIWAYRPRPTLSSGLPSYVLPCHLAYRPLSRASCVYSYRQSTSH